MLMNFGKYKKQLWYFTRVMAVICCGIYLIHKLYNQENYISSAEPIYNQSNWMIYLLLIVLLMILNWLIETIKWKQITNSLEKISWKKAIKSTLAGVTLASFTPNRTGEFIGKIAYLTPGNRINGTTLSFLNSFSQFICTLLFGGMAYYYLRKDIATLHKPEIHYVLVAITCIALLIYFRYSIIVGSLNKVSPRWFGKFWNNHFHITFPVLSKVFFLSIIRYSVFCLQFFLALKLFNSNIDTQLMAALIPLMYLITTLTPSISLAELGIREIAAVELFGLFTSNLSSILLATFFIWTINILIPSILGSYFLLQRNKS